MWCLYRQYMQNDTSTPQPARLPQLAQAYQSDERMQTAHMKNKK